MKTNISLATLCCAFLLTGCANGLMEPDNHSEAMVDKARTDAGLFQIEVVSDEKSFLLTLRSHSAHYIGHCQSRYYIAKYIFEPGKSIVRVYTISRQAVETEVLRKAIDDQTEYLEKSFDMPMQYPLIVEYLTWRAEHVKRTEPWEKPRRFGTSSLGALR